MSDTIYRSDAIKAVFATKDGQGKTRFANEAKKNLENLQSAQPERKGKWIAHPGGKFVGFPYMHYECDQCRDFEPEERNFCPECGADMRGEEDERA